MAMRHEITSGTWDDRPLGGPYPVPDDITSTDLSEESARAVRSLLHELRDARSLEDVYVLIARWTWKVSLAFDPELPAKFERARNYQGTPITLEELRIKLGLPLQRDPGTGRQPEADGP